MKFRSAILGNLLSAFGCGSDALNEGGVYSIDNGDRTFGVLKILKLEPKVVHVRVYKNKFNSRPTSIKVEELSLGSIKDKGGFGMGHLPMSKIDFMEWKAVLLTKTEVSPEELEGYTIWKEAGGGVFGR